MVLTGQTTNPRASEGGHWYDRDGTPRYEVPTADGKSLRAATLRDARKFGWYPGVTSITKCAAAPQLENWKQDQVLLAALTLPRLSGENDAAFCERVITDSQEQGRKARERGTEIHAAIQGHYEGVAPSEEFWPFVRGVTEMLAANFGPQEWRTELPCAHRLGFGTKVDLSAANIVLDFKGKEFTKDELHSVKTWDDHDMQLAAGREALIKPQAVCGIVYVSRNVPGLCKLCLVDEPELMRGWDMFRGLLNYWKANRNYYPELWKQKEAA